MDIGNNDAQSVTDREDEGTWVHLHDELGNLEYEPKVEAGKKATADNKPVRVKIAGTYSSRYRMARLKQRDRSMQRARQRVEAETVEEQERQVVADCFLEWECVLANGKPLDLTPKNAALLLKLRPWNYDELVVAQNDHASFLKARSED